MRDADRLFLEAMQAQELARNVHVALLDAEDFATCRVQHTLGDELVNREARLER